MQGPPKHPDGHFGSIWHTEPGALKGVRFQKKSAFYRVIPIWRNRTIFLNQACFPSWIWESCFATKIYFWHTWIPPSALFFFFFLGGGCTGEKWPIVVRESKVDSKQCGWTDNTIRNVLVSLFLTRWMISVLFVSWKCMLLKKNSPRAEHLTFAPFLYFLIYLQVWLRSRLGEVSLLHSALSFFFFTRDWSPPALRSILTRSPCFVSWKFLILLMQTEMLSSAVQHSLGSRAWAGHLSPFFFFFFFWKHLPDPGKKAREIH